MAFTEYKGEVIPFSFEDEAIDKVLSYEGGYNPKDAVTGMPVKYGIDQKANPDVDVSKLSKSDAGEILREKYWKASGAGSLPKDLALVHFDAAVNQGSASKRFLEESGGDVNKYIDLRRQHYIYLAEANPEKYGSSLKGWLNRLDKVEKDIASMDKPTFKEYDGEILPLSAKATKKPAGEYQLSPEEQMMAPIGADTTGGIELSDYGKLFGAGAVKGTLGAPEAIEAGTQGLARDTIFKPTEVLEYLADPQKLQQAVANAFGFKVKEKRGETPLTDLKESQQRAVDEVLTRGKIPQLRDLTEIGNSISQYMEDSVTPEMKEALAESQPTGNIIEAFNTGDFSKLSLGDKPSFAGLAGQAVRVFGTSTPAILTSIITKSPLAGGTVAFGQAGSEGVEEARKHIEGMDFEELSNKSEYFRNLVALGYSPEKAKEMTIAKAGDTAAYMQGIVGALGNEFTANLITGKLSKSALLNASNVATRVTKAVAAGAAEDAFQETMEGIATDLGIDKTVVREIGVDSFANMVLGAIGGGGPGFVGGVKGEIGRAPKGAAAPEERVEPTFREVTPEEMQNMVPITPEEEFAGAPAIDITGVGEVPAEEAPATTQDIAAMMAELEEKAPQAPIEEPAVEETKVEAREAKEIESDARWVWYELSDEERLDLQDYLTSVLEARGDVNVLNIPEEIRNKLDTGRTTVLNKIFKENPQETIAALTPKTSTKNKAVEEPVVEKPKFVKDDEGKKITYPIFVDLAEKGYDVLGFDNPRTYTNKGGNKYRTLEKNGVRIALEGQQILFTDPKYPNRQPQLGMGNENDVVFHFLGVDPELRKQGKAKEALQDLIDVADKNNYTLYGEPAQLEKDGMSVEQLNNLYANYGFKLEDDTGKVIVREPGAKYKKPELKPKEGKAVSIKDMTPEDQKSIRAMEVEKNKIAREKKLFPEFLARQGIQPSEKKDLGLEGISRPRIFRNSAPTFDELTSRAISEGFLLSTGDDVQDVENFREHVANYIGNGVISTGPDTAREGQIGSIDDAIAQIYRKYEKPEFGLEQPTPEQLKAEAARKKAEEDAEIDREMAEKARQSREEIKRRSEAAATEFELGRTAEEDLTGQKRLDDPDADIPFFSMPAKKKLPPGRNAELAEAAQRLRDGNITKREYDDIVKRLDPAKLYAEVPAPASDAKMVEALDVNKREKIHPQIADGQRVGTRLDIPAARKGAFVVSIHQPRTPSKVGQVIGYDSTAVLNDVVFATGNEKKALEIASGGAKDVLQTIEGSWQNVAPAEAERMAKEAIDSPEWIQVGVNPTRHSYFYDRDTMEPVVQADQIIQIGNLVLAKNPTYASKESFLFVAPQDLLARQDERIREELRDEKIRELQSVKQRMAAITKRFGKKKLKTLDQEIYSALEEQAKELNEAILDLYEPNLTPEQFVFIAGKSLRDKKDGITWDVYNVIVDLAKKNPKILNGLRLSVSAYPGDRSPEGEFKPYKRMVYLYKGTSGMTDPRVIMHEINHSLEQMMPREARKAVVEAWRKALVKAAKEEQSPQGIKFFEAVNELIKNPNRETFDAALDAMPPGDATYYQYITPSEYWAINAEDLMQSYLGGAWQRFKTAVKAFFEAMKNVLGMPNRWVIYKAFDQAINGERKGFQQMNDYIRGVVPMYSAHKNFAGGPAPLAEWTSPDESKIADFIYKIQDKFVDVKDVQKAIVEEIDSIDDRFNAYMKEELYHGRTAKRIEDFLRYELLPIIKKLKSAGISITEFDDFLHNRHAEERNKQVAKVNPAMPDQGSGIKTADAQAYLAGLDPKQRATMENIANDIDNMIRGTQQLLVDYGLEEQSTIDQWNKTYKHYVPLMRDDLDFAHSVTGLGQGLATRGKTSKRATGSLKDVVDIFANLAIQRERAIIRGEKSRVGKALYGLAIQNPNPDFWLPVNPDAIKDTEGLLKELINIGLSPEDARNFIKEPSTQDIDPKTGLVTKRVNVNNRYADNVFSVRVNGKDRFIFFNPSDPRAMRMVKAMKNMDAEQFGGIIGNIANVTRFVASVNTQYNPVFGAWNFARDVQGAAFNLSTTPIAGKQKEVMAGVFPALRAIYKDLRAERKGKKADGEWVDLFERFEKAGAKTGYRDQFAQSRKKANIIEREMANLNRGNVRKVAGAVMDWLSDYNDSMENAVRLSAFKVGLDQGLSEEQAASMAKNLTVNFNRKGAWSQGLGALYAFFNASVQGSARILETLRGPAGKKIIAGGMLLGVFQALALMMAGFDEDEPPEFLKDKNLIIPYGGEGKYFIIPMPLGFSAIPSTGRRISEMVIYGGNIPQKTIGLMGMLMDAFNPMGNGSFAQMLSPTAVDPFVSADMNKDSFGRPIYKEDKSTNPTPGYERSREGASDFSKGLSWLLNYISSGGYEYKKGFISPTADEIDYVIGQYTGGVGREVMKAIETVKGAITGEEVPPHRKPVTGKILGDINTPQAITGKFYKNITEMAQHEHQIKGMSKDDEDVDAYIEESPEAALYKKANDVENRVNEINKKIKKLRDTKDEDNKDAIKDLEESKIEIMKDFNEMVKEEKAQ